MNRSSNSILFIIKYLLLPAVVVKLLYSVSLFYLDKELLPISEGGNISFITKTKLAYN